MSGNVREWTCSEYDSAYQGGELRCISAKQANDHRVLSLRGGSFKSDAKDVRSAARDFTKTKAWLVTDPQMPKSIWWYSDCIDVGFRVVCEADSIPLN